MKRSLFLLATFVLGLSAFAQERPQVSPGVGNAVLLAKNSIQLDRDVVVVSGDVIANNATSGPFLGELALSLDRAVHTPAGYKLAATSVDLDQDAVAGGGTIVHLTGGGYAFASITIGSGASLRYAAPADFVVSGRVDLGPNSVVGRESGSGLTASAMRIQVDGINGSTGAMTATPAAV